MNRRQFTVSVAAAVAASLAKGAREAQALTQSQSTDPTGAAQTSAAYQIAMVAYPGMTALDLIGPQYALSSIMGSRVSIVAKTREPVVTDTGVTIVPDLTFETCPRDLTVLFIPGGSQGTLNAMTDSATIGFVRDRGSHAKWVTSVCTGSLLLGSAGLLRGYAATSHWLVRDTVLPILEVSL